MSPDQRVRFIADVLAVTQAEDADNRSARQTMLAEQMSAPDSDILPLMLSAFAGPETVPDTALNPALLARIRQEGKMWRSYFNPLLVCKTQGRAAQQHTGEKQKTKAIHRALRK